MSIEELLTAGVVRRLVDMVFDRIQRSKAMSTGQTGPDISIQRSALERSVARTAKWCEWTQDAPTQQLKETEATTIELRLTRELKRQFGPVPDEKSVTEIDMLIDPRSCLLLGDPGAGKTTTFKRLARHVLTEDAVAEQDNYQYPIVVVCRSVELTNGLYRTLASIFEIAYDQHEKKSNRPSPTVKLNRAKFGAHKSGSRSAKETETIITVDDMVGQRRLGAVIAEYLEETQALLIVDGLDEVPSTVSRQFRAELAELGSCLSRAKIMASCRTGDFQGGFDGFELYELSALKSSQIHSIAQLRLGEQAADFENRLQISPVAELADRPLFLNYLLVLYERNGVLPPQPAEVYKRVVRLLLEDWDKTRDIQRVSAYGMFDSDSKREFLSALAFSLTYECKTKSFSESLLIELYSLHHGRYGLPEGEALKVAQEIESHTGIVTESSFGKFEFSHLVLQEYLCAEYLLRSPITPEMSARISSYMAPLAIAVALAPSPSEWFAHLVLSSTVPSDWNYTTSKSFLSRLALELPHFSRNRRLGFAMLKLLHLICEESATSMFVMHLPGLLGVDAVRGSIEDALHFYEPLPDSPNAGLAIVHRKTHFHHEALAPEFGAYPISICAFPNL